jgi:hypothetical protein
LRDIAHGSARRRRCLPCHFASPQSFGAKKEFGKWCTGTRTRSSHRARRSPLSRNSPAGFSDGALETFVRKGELTAKRKMRDWPHHVTIPIPPVVGLPHLQEMHAFCKDRDYQTVSVNGSGQGDSSVWCFKHPEDAAAFAVRFGGTRG